MPLEWAWGRLYVNRGSSGRLTIVFAEDMMACRIATEAMKDEHELKVIRTRRKVGVVRIQSSSSQPIVFIGRGHLAWCLRGMQREKREGRRTVISQYARNIWGKIQCPWERDSATSRWLSIVWLDVFLRQGPVLRFPWLCQYGRQNVACRVLYGNDVRFQSPCFSAEPEKCAAYGRH